MRTLKLSMLAVAAAAVGACTPSVSGVNCDNEGFPCATGGVCRGGLCVDLLCRTDGAADCGFGQSCVEDNGAMICRPSFSGIQITAPGDATLISQPRLSVTAELQRNPAAPADAPTPDRLTITATHVASGTVETAALARQSGTTYAGEVTLVHPGAYELVASSDALGLSSTKVTVTLVDCSPSCGTGEECLSGSCQPILGGLTIIDPTEGQYRKAPVTVQVAFAKTENALSPLPQDIDVTATDGASRATTIKATLDTSSSPALYKGSLSVTDGVYTLIARALPNIASGAVTFTVDTQPPTIVLDVQPYPTRVATSATNLNVSWTDPGASGTGTTQYFRRDESFAITVSAYDAVDPASVVLVIVDPDGNTVRLPLDQWQTPQPPLTAPACPPTTTTPSFCKSHAIDVSKIGMSTQFRGVLTLSAEASDLAGNRGTPAGAAVALTRFKFAVNAEHGPVSTPPLILPTGGVLFGTAGNPLGSTSSGLFLVSPDGNNVPLALGFDQVPNQLLAVPDANGTTQTIYGVTVERTSVGTGRSQLFYAGGPNTAAPTPLTCRTNSSEIELRDLVIGMAVVGGQNALVGVANRYQSMEPGVLVLAAPFTSTGVTCTAFPLTSNVHADTNLLIDGSSVYFGDANGALRRLTLTGFATGWDSTKDDVFSLNMAGAAIEPMLTPDKNVVGIAHTSSSGALFRLDGDAQTGTTPTIRTLTDIPTHAVNTEDQKLIVGLMSQTTTGVQVAPQDLSDAGANVALDGAGVVQAAPVLGYNRSAYVLTAPVSMVGHPSLRVVPGTGPESWSASFEFGTTTAPTIDCSRTKDNTGWVGRQGAPGVLYFGNDAGRLTAVVVDSPGFDPAPSGDFGPGWGKWRHDPMNTANALPDWSRPFSCGH